MGEFGEAFEDAKQILVPGTAQDLHIAGAALRAERSEPRQLVAALRRGARGEGAQRAHQVLRLALAGLPWILAEADPDRFAASCVAMLSSNRSTSPGLARRRTTSSSQ